MSHHAPRDTRAAQVDTSEQDFSEAVVLQDRLRAPNCRTTRVPASAVSALTGDRMRLHRVAQGLRGRLPLRRSRRSLPMRPAPLLATPECDRGDGELPYHRRRPKESPDEEIRNATEG